MTLRAAFVAAALAAVAACSQSITELEDMREAYDEGRYEAVAEAALDCELGDEGCARSTEIKADSCLRVAQARVAERSAAAAAAPAACASENYQALLSAGLGDREALTARELEALRLARESAGDAATGAARNARLADRAAAYSAIAPARGEGPYYAASALFWSTTFEGARDACSALTRVRDLAARAAAAPVEGDGPPGGVRGPAGDLERRATEAARAEGCAGV